MTQSFTLIVTKSPFDSRNAENAIAFCQAALNTGYKIEQVFFYQSGVQNASHLLLPGSDEFNVREQWLALHNQYGLRLNVCTTAGARRGVVVNTDLTRLSELLPQQANIQAPFEAVGLSAYFEALASNSISIQL